MGVLLLKENVTCVIKLNLHDKCKSETNAKHLPKIYFLKRVNNYVW